MSVGLERRRSGLLVPGGVGQTGLVRGPGGGGSAILVENFTTATNPKARFTVITDDVTWTKWQNDQVESSNRSAVAFFTRRDWGPLGDTKGIELRYQFADYTHSGKIILAFVDRATSDRVEVCVPVINGAPGQAQIEMRYGPSPYNTLDINYPGGAAWRWTGVNAGWYRLQLERAGNNYTGTVRLDDGTLVKQVVLALPAGAPQAEFGAGKGLDPGFQVSGWDSQVNVDDFRVL